MVIMGIDPSFNSLALSILNVDTKTVYVNKFSYKLGDNIGFDKILTASISLWEEMHSYLDRLISDGKITTIDEVFSEVPPPTAQFSSGLFSLDTLILYKLYETYISIKKIHCIPPSYVGVIHGTRKYDKGDSTKLATYLVNEVLQDYLTLVIPDNVSAKGRKTKGRLNNDTAESLLFLLRAIVKYDIYGLRNTLVSEMIGFSHEAEKLVIERDL